MQPAIRCIYRFVNKKRYGATGINSTAPLPLMQRCGRLSMALVSQNTATGVFAYKYALLSTLGFGRGGRLGFGRGGQLGFGRGGCSTGVGAARWFGGFGDGVEIRHLGQIIH